ncbi:transcriptional regulator [Mycolicibacterium mageritense DSM 44476 = CIP 104973]|uniref:Transcriptional regulator n=1 Tax=Mycolicibacterium mageritense TaxID=53462 RepID=A0AAI8XQ23_MYCME|nr:LuxR family transcriptional regulator [Mycolicibacterium mageritense]MCC9180372.1 AAA family ATPase [Mycolicibacterium mageritense]TXI52958.1 MAG: LuxR family transcriptional regulator [Mycolicibacterium mageritense]CDO19841.1 transcriptional regulator [Mycolicibacterium mageritense DSM 44476 = CIP 104973]BBX35653.1 transcriptional regulator [Mycolicibacterium mageritense]BDY30552.1 HTH-type transcriptional regulator MalT [Mycolicibacterium mageritense]
MSLIGRTDEFSSLTSAASHVTQAGRALVIEGEPGIGKTTMLATVAQWAGDNGFTVLSCAGVQCQTKVGYAGVHELVHPLLGYAEALPTHQRRALLAAFGMEEHEQPNPLLIGVAMLGLIEEAAAHKPLMLIVDDAQWLDGSSLHVLTFVGRRLANSPVMLLCATRPGLDGEPARLVSLSRVPLGPVDEVTSRAILAEAVTGMGERAPNDLIQRRILTEAAGNPLAIAELAKAVVNSGEQSAFAASAPLPTTRRIERVFLEQLDSLPDPSRAMLALISAGDEASLVELIDAAHRVGLSENALDPLERGGLITVDDGQIRVRHPLIRSVAYRAVGLAQRSAFHRALADASTDPMRAAWQRSAAAYGPDETIAAELELAADSALRRGANDEAAAALRRAAALSPSSDSRVRRLVGAIMPAYRAGLSVEAIDILGDAEPLATDPIDLFELAFARFTMGVTTGVAAPRVSDLVALADRLGASGEREYQTRMLAAAAAQCRMHGLCERDRYVVAEALHSLEHRGDPSIEIALATVEDTKYARHFRSESERLRAQVTGDVTALMSMGLAAESVSDLDIAQACWSEAIGVAHAEGAPTLECEALRGSARAQIVAGHLQEATVSAQGALRIATDANLSISTGAAAALLARAHVWRGEVRAAEQTLATARQHLPTDTPLLWLDELAWASGLLALTVHDYQQAFVDLSKMTRDRGARRWAIADLTEAAVGSRHAGMIGEVIDEIAAEATTLGSDHVAMLVHRSRGLLASDDADAEHHFGSALQYADAAEQSPLEYARTQLCYGEWLRRQRRIVDARAQLSSALRVFESRGAQPYARRARGELRAAGVQLPGVTVEDRVTELTPQELQIAQLAAAGLSNQQIADRIYVSHRTVGAHLYKIFPKLGITSRNQLRDVLDDGNSHASGS